VLYTNVCVQQYVGSGQRRHHLVSIFELSNFHMRPSGLVLASTLLCRNAYTPGKLGWLSLAFLLPSCRASATLVSYHLSRTRCSAATHNTFARERQTPPSGGHRSGATSRTRDQIAGCVGRNSTSHSTSHHADNAGAAAQVRMEMKLQAVDGRLHARAPCQRAVCTRGGHAASPRVQTMHYKRNTRRRLS
jgi:hypothetical protein